MGSHSWSVIPWIENKVCLIFMSVIALTGCDQIAKDIDTANRINRMRVCIPECPNVYRPPEKYNCIWGYRREIRGDDIKLCVAKEIYKEGEYQLPESLESIKQVVVKERYCPDAHEPNWLPPFCDRGYRKEERDGREICVYRRYYEVGEYVIKGK